MPKYTIVHGDTLPLVAEKLGHSGQWQELAAANLALVPDELQLSDEAKAAVIAERMTPGVELDVPNTWSEVEIEPPAGRSETPAAKAREAAEQFEEHKAERRR